MEKVNVVLARSLEEMERRYHETRAEDLQSLQDQVKPFKLCRFCKGPLKRKKTKAGKRGFCASSCSRKDFHTNHASKVVPKVSSISKRLKKIGVPGPEFYQSRQWQELRYKTIKKYERKCMVCFRTGIELHVDHIKPISKYPGHALDPSNLQVLCRDCNLGKSNKDEIDWRIK